MSDEPLATGAFVGRESFRHRLRQGFAAAARQGWREWVVCDADFQDWPLDEGAVIDALQAWALRGQRLILLARDYGVVARRAPRFVQWRRQWAHKLDCRVCARADAKDLHALFWSPVWVLQRPEPMPGHGLSDDDSARIAQWRERLDHWIQRSQPGFAAYTLGL